MPELLWAGAGGYLANRVPPLTGSGSARFGSKWSKPIGFAHILLLSVRTTYIWLDTPGFLWMAPKRSAAWEGWVRNYCGLGGGYAGTSVGLGGGMPEPLWAQGGYPGKFGGGMPELLGGRGGVCRNLSGLTGGYAGTFGGLGGVMPELVGD